MILSKFVRIIPNTKGYILCHTLNRCIVQIDETHLVNNELVAEKFSKMEVDYLSENDFFSNNPQKYIDATDYSERNITTIIINITEYCNFDCTYCYQNDFDSFNVITVELIQKIINYVEYVLRQGEKNIYVYFFGGEPLLFKKNFFN